jgi:hypothetical protein
VNQVVQGSSEALGPKWLTGNGAVRTLCAGDVETPFLGGEAP